MGSYPDRDAPRRQGRTRQAVAAVAIALLSVIGGAAVAVPANAITVSGTVPNRMVRVYKCSYMTGRCVYWYQYQQNGSYNPTVPTYWYRQNSWCWCWV